MELLLAESGLVPLSSGLSLALGRRQSSVDLLIAALRTAL